MVLTLVISLHLSIGYTREARIKYPIEKWMNFEVKFRAQNFYY